VGHIDETFACDHPKSVPESVCAHMLSRIPTELPPGLRIRDYWKRYTGRRLAYALLCGACDELPDDRRPALAPVCRACFKTLEDEGVCRGVSGEPEIPTAARQLRLELRAPYYGGLNALAIADIQPLHRGGDAQWLALTAKGCLLKINKGSNFVELSKPLAAPVDFASALTMRLSVDERYLAIANTYGTDGCVIDLEKEESCLTLKRDDYHIEHCIFPLAFFEKDGRPLLLHGTQWNRLDVTDPATGELLTKRQFVAASEEESAPHALDYFHGRLDVSPGGAYALDNGWVWHPVGMPAVFSLKKWLSGNVWESEDGPSRRNLAQREYYWPSPACWIDDQTLALSGLDDDHLSTEGVRLIDPGSGKCLNSFAGPSGDLFYDAHLFASGPYGFAAWDIATGERLLERPSFHPQRYNRTTKEFLSLLPGNVLQIGRVLEP